MKTTYEIDGNNFSDLVGFYIEFSDKVLGTKDWGHNLDALNDVLRGGFGTPFEGFLLVWNNSEKSMEILGWPETVKFLDQKLTKCHPSNVESVNRDLEEAKQGHGQTLFQIIVGIIKEHRDIELVLK
jgi:RNAse (barnase) inhibitor barstar